MKRIAALFSLTLSFLLSVAAHAEEYADYDPETAQTQISAPLFVIIAYSIIWLLVCYFAVTLWRRQQRIEGELAGAKAQLEDLQNAQARRS